jgi:hypothetical protein
VDDVTDIARKHYRKQRQISNAVTRALLAKWAKVEQADISASWTAQLEDAALIVTAGQAAAARDASTYISKVGPSELVASPSGFASRTAGGSPLTGLLTNPIITSKLGIARGLDPSRALSLGGSQLGLLVSNEVQQAGRNAASVGIVAVPEITGYVRMLQQPSCSRCIVLAGRWYPWSSGFKRHELCDCAHVPSYDGRKRGDRTTTDPQTTFDAMSKADQDKTFGTARAAAIREGADISQVVNTSRKGATYTFDVGGKARRATTEGTSIREGLAGRRMAIADRQLFNADGSLNFAADWERAARPRLTVGQIYKDAAGDRLKTRDLLHQYGYLEPAKGMRRSQQSLYAALGVDVPRS